MAKIRVTIKDVAKEAGVSIAMVSLVLNAKLDEYGNPECSVRKETAKKIFDTVKRLGYIPNRSAAFIRSGRSYTIAVITSDISSNFFSKLCRHIENTAYDQGYNVIFASSDENPVKFTQVLDSTLQLGVDGMIIVPPPHSEVTVGKISAMNIPIVLLERDIPEMKECGRVLLDNARANTMAIDELYNSGYRQIELVVHNLDITTIHSRVDDYRSSMTRLGLEDLIKVHYVEYGADVDAIANMIKNAVERGCEAIYFSSNTISVLAMQAIKQLRLKVPEELAFVAFNHSPVYNVFDPAVTHIEEPIRSLAEESFSLLVEMIEDRSAAKTIRLAPSMVRGGSSAPRK